MTRPNDEQLYRHAQVWPSCLSAVDQGVVVEAAQFAGYDHLDVRHGSSP